jgi:tetratricopeptide (TPR) repeat protein
LKGTLRVLLIVVVLTAAIVTIRLWVVIPYRCNLATERATSTVLMITTMEKSLRAAELARMNVDRLKTCVVHCPLDVAAAMDLAASYRFLGLHEEAVSIYQSALNVDRRAELYLNLGQAQIDAGDRKQGLQNLITACLYNPSYIDDIAEQHIEVRGAIDRYQLQLKALEHQVR